jgi:hypothetical protein
MENAHLRLGLLEYERHTEKISTRIRVRVSHYTGEGQEAHLLSVFGNDSDVGAITAAVHDQARFKLTFPDGRVQEMTLGERAACYRGSITVPLRKHSVRHMVALSEEIRGLRSHDRIYALNSDTMSIWTAVVQRLGLPATPEWAGPMTELLREQDRIQTPESIGCLATVVKANAEEVLEAMESAIARGAIQLPEKNGPIQWPNVNLREALRALSAAG